MEHCVKPSVAYGFYYAASLFLFCSKVQEQFITLNNEIEGFKRASKDEMLKNERLTIILKKIHSEEANLKRLTSVLEEKRNTVETHLSAVHSMLEQTDREMQEITLVSMWWNTRKVNLFASLILYSCVLLNNVVSC
jgi:hypothetical protein